MHDPGLAIGEAIDNDGLQALFKCSVSGGMRRSHSTKTLVIVSDHTRGIYEDRWDGNVLHYTGMGLRGDQKWKGTQNKTLGELDSNGVDVHLFEVSSPGRYTYQGRVGLAGDPYESRQPDADGKDRRVWIFPVQLTDTNAPVAPNLEELSMQRRRRERAAGKLSIEQLLARIKSDGGVGPGKRTVMTTQHTRDPHVSELAKRLAKGRCQLCGESAPFKKRGGIPYLETHHIQWLSRGGPDIIENTVALCPNCHRRIHVLDRVSDQRRLQGAASSSLATLGRSNT